VFPAADASYTLSVPYYFLPGALDNFHEYPLGGMMHAETIKESCLAAAERMDSRMGPHTEIFKARLAASVSADRRLKPAHGRYNGDNSESRERLSRCHDVVVTYNGVTY